MQSAKMVKTTRRLSPQSGIVSGGRPGPALRCNLHASGINVLAHAFPCRDRSTKSAASSASLRSVLRGVLSAPMVTPRAKSVTWIARTATGKSGGISPAVIPSRKRPSTSAAPPAAAFCRNRRTSASFTSGATHTRRQPRADPFSVARSARRLAARASGWSWLGVGSISRRRSLPDDRARRQPRKTHRRRARKLPGCPPAPADRSR